MRLQVWQNSDAQTLRFGAGFGDVFSLVVEVFWSSTALVIMPIFGILSIFESYVSLFMNRIVPFKPRGLK